MALVFKTNVEEAAEATSFRLYDTSIGWGTDGDPEKVDIAAIFLVVTSALNEVVNYDLLAKVDDFLSEDGVEILISEIFPDLEGFPDDSYSFNVIWNIDGSDMFNADDSVNYTNVLKYYDNNQGFMAYIREASRQLPLPLDWQQFDYEDNRKIHQLYILMDGAEADANVGNTARFAAKMAYVSEQLNRRNISYGS